MENNQERRREQRLHYYWPVWYAEDFNHILSQGQLTDISSGGAAFTCYADEKCPYVGQSLTARFSVPRFDSDDSFDLANYTRTGKVLRVDETNGYVRRVALQFRDPLPFKPGEQFEEEAETQDKLRAVTI